jgi:hypothetical protein
MKPKWRDAIYDAAAAGKEFEHADGCPVIFYATRKPKGCTCAAGPANEALIEIDEALKDGIPIGDA